MITLPSTIDRDPMTDFQGKRALVTGATSGIGRATALLLHARGATVLATGRRTAALDTPADDRWLTLAGDLTDDRFRRALVDAARDRLGGLDVLVNAAGILVAGTWETTDLAGWDRMLDINLRSVFDLTRRAIPLLQEHRGAVVNVSSVTGTRAFPGVLAYCVSKAAIDQLTRCLALELASSGVRVNAVNPGVVRSGLHRNGGMAEDTYAQFLERSTTTHPLGRVGTPEEVAELIAFLGSDRAGWITGECVAIDGGRAQTCAR
jgi:NAD(P)-dependent dehydrogenase (short-subunit alcohol dehydrogenase family)